MLLDELDAVKASHSVFSINHAHNRFVQFSFIMFTISFQGHVWITHDLLVKTSTSFLKTTILLLSGRSTTPIILYSNA